MTISAHKPVARQVTVDADNAGRRLDNFLLAELKGLPRSRVYRLIRTGEVRVNKGRSKPASRLAEGDVVRIPPVSGLAGRSPAHVPANDRLNWIRGRILHEDSALLVLDKPSGLAVHGGSGISLGAIELLRAARPDCPYLELVHRLDRATSGCLVVAKKRSALRNLHEQLREGNVVKRYKALLCGSWQGDDREVALPLLVTARRDGERHVRTDAEGKPAVTRFYPVERFSRAVLCDVELLTGRTHQIRVHGAAIGHPVAGDERYGAAKQEQIPLLRRLFLHAASIAFSHPQATGLVRYESPLPEDLKKVLQALRHRADHT